MESQPLVGHENGAQDTPKVDINQAGVDELTALPGIGPALAGRIIARREEAGPFVHPEDLETIAGIGPALAARIAAQVTFAPSWDLPDDDQELPGETPPPFPKLEGEEDTGAQPLPTSPFEEGAIASEPEFATDALPEEESAEVMPGEGAPPLEESRLTPQPPPREAAPRRRTDWIWSSLLGAVLGGLLGLILTMLLFAGINGSLDVGRSRGFRSLASQVNGLGVEIAAVRDDVSGLQGDLSGLRQRVEVLSGLTARMEQAEATLDTFTGAIRTLQQQTGVLQTALDGLEQEVGALEETVADIEVQTEKTMSFFDRLRTALDEVFGDPEEVDK
jgi:competence ComEA-like helix-hairpin-helix protein